MVQHQCPPSAHAFQQCPRVHPTAEGSAVVHLLGSPSALPGAAAPSTSVLLPSVASSPAPFACASSPTAVASTCSCTPAIRCSVRSCRKERLHSSSPAGHSSSATKASGTSSKPTAQSAP